MSMDFDAIVIGSGITGGWAAKELTEAGLKTLMLERGRMVEHQTDYTTEAIPPWEMQFRGFGDPEILERDYAIQSKGRSFDEWSQHFFVNDRENPYSTTKDQPFQWRRGYQLGGRSLLWGRQCYRWSDLDFGANARDGIGNDWPIRYADLAPWYDKIEEFIGVSGSIENLPQLPDGKFQPPMALNVVEAAFKHAVEAAYPSRRVMMGRSANITRGIGDRSPCQYRGICQRGCSYGAYFSTQSSTLPAARATGRLTLVTHAVVDSLEFDPVRKRVTAVKVVDAHTRARTRYTAPIVFLCASTINSVSILLRSDGPDAPRGLGNSSGMLGRCLMDHAGTLSIMAEIDGFDAHAYFGNRPNNIIIPRFKNVDAETATPAFRRGYSFQGGAFRDNWPRGGTEAGIGADLKQELRKPGRWVMLLGGFGECLPDPDNRITLDPVARDPLGMRMTHVAFKHGENAHRLMQDAMHEAARMVALMRGRVLFANANPGLGGTSVHEMGGARMGRDPKTSVIDGYNRLWDAPNLFITDGAAMASTACQNPSLTYMALTARAAANAVALFRAHQI